jgi:tripartite-type tricarboxylate transporter receptor subunit TctC
MNRLAICFAITLFASTGVSAQAPVSLEGKVVTITVGFSAGGGTDVAARLVASHLGKYLPGKPEIIVQNRPGADGLTAANYFANQSKPDGTNLLLGAAGTIDPAMYRKSEARYDPTQWGWVGGVGRGGSLMSISNEAEKRLRDKSAQPVTMASIGGGQPHATLLATAWGIEFLGWNVKWVTGYRGTSDIILAMERGEVDMSGTGSVKLIQRLTDTGKFKVLVQTGTFESGTVKPRSDLPNVPLFPDMMKGKIKDPLQQKAYDYWIALLNMDKCLALPPNTPKPILDAYREAFEKLFFDSEFQVKAKAMSDDFTLQHPKDTEDAIKTLAATPSEAVAYISDMVRRQGIPIAP